MIGIRLSSAIRLHYLQSLFAQTIHVLDSMPSGAAASTITATANVLQLGISEKLGTFIEFMGTIVAAIIVAFTWGWELTLITSTVVLFIFLVIGTLLPFILKGHGRMTRVCTLRKAQPETVWQRVADWLGSRLRPKRPPSPASRSVASG